jgi:carboxymethylenebutenolidase
MPDGEGPFPGLIVIHEWWGLNSWIKQNADMFAGQGYVVLAIDLYRGKVAGSPEEAHEIMRALPEDRAVKDLKSAFQYLSSLEKTDKGNIGSIGWCMGGGYSLAAAMNIPDLKACVICYGRLVTEEESLEKIKSPVLGIFGEDDRGIPVADVRTFESALREDGKEVVINVYPGVGHAFMNPNNKNGYSEDTSNKAWEEIHQFLKDKLK